MRLCEITGSSEAEVYEKLRVIRLTLKSASTVSNISPELKNLIEQLVNTLNEDEVNLISYILSSERISALYSEIKSLI